MGLKLKVLGLGLLAILATSAFAVMNAGATSNGHFVSDSTTSHINGEGKSIPTTTLVGQESLPPDFSHKLEFSSGISANKIFCKEATFHGTQEGTSTENTATSIEITPTYAGCETTEGSNKEVTVTFNGCKYVFTPRATGGDATAGLNCPVGKKVELHDKATGCTLTFGTQHRPNAVTYTNIVENGKHAITLNSTAANIVYEAHNGICVFIGTNHNDGRLDGAATVTGFDTEGNQVNITHT